VPAVRASLRVEVPAAGWLEALNASPIAVPRVPTGGLKVKVLVPEGSTVAAGDVVIVFDDTALELELVSHRATFRSAGRRLDRTELQGRMEAAAIQVMREIAQLEHENAASFDLDDAAIYSKRDVLEEQVKKREASETIVFATASLRLRGEYYDIEERIIDVDAERAKGKIERVETSLAQVVLRAPLGGMVVYRKNWRGASVSVGDTLWPGNVVMSIVDPSAVALKAHVLDRDASSVKPGALARVRVDARPDLALTGNVKTVAELAAPIERNSPVKYVEVLLEIAGADPALLRPGMKGSARIVTAEAASAVVIPRAAVRGSAEEPWVLVSGEDGPERRTVELGPGDPVRVAVSAGLEEGELVLLGGPDVAAPAAEAAAPQQVAAPPRVTAGG
jgi:multidrug efflux pump subunit AcrA (membrane-fusion protein)